MIGFDYWSCLHLHLHWALDLEFACAFVLFIGLGWLALARLGFALVIGLDYWIVWYWVGLLVWIGLYWTSGLYWIIGWGLIGFVYWIGLAWVGFDYWRGFGWIVLDCLTGIGLAWVG